MKLRCTDCGHTHLGASPVFEDTVCLENNCRGVLKYVPASLPMVGDPIEADERISSRNFDRQKVLYKHVMDQKRGIVPERFRVGLWYHL